MKWVPGNPYNIPPGVVCKTWRENRRYISSSCATLVWTRTWIPVTIFVIVSYIAFSLILLPLLLDNL